jgi:Protein of unknown function (DUF551)
MTEPFKVGALGAASAPLDLKPIEEQIDRLLGEGGDHIADWKTHGGHSDGPDGECQVCDDIFGHATMLRDLVLEVERLRVEHTRAVLHFTLKGYTAGENADSKAWRKRAEAAEAEVATLRALPSAPSSAPGETEPDEEMLHHSFDARSAADDEIWCTGCDYHRDHEIHIFPAPSSAPAWQPIETAPKMRTVLLFAVTDVDEDGAVRNTNMSTGFWHTGYNEWIWDGDRIAAWESQPTHWMPLPDPPSSAPDDETKTATRVDGVPADRPLGSTASRDEAK